MLYPEYPYVSNFLKIGDNNLHYIDEGCGPVVIMLHGNPTWSFYYRNLIASLRPYCRVIVPDHMGCGLSDKPQEYSYTLSQHIKNVGRLVEHLGIKKFSLVVHDWGGAIGFGYCVNHLENVEKILVMNSGAFRSSRIPFRINLCKYGFLGELLVRGLNGFAWPASFMAVEKTLPKDIVKGYLAPYNSWENRIAVHRFVQDIPMNRDHPSYKTLLAIEKGLVAIRKGQVPIQLIWGGKDFCFNDAFFSEWQQHFPEATSHYFPDAGHYVLEDKKSEVIKIAKEFFHCNA